MNKSDFSAAQLRVIWIAIGVLVLSFVYPPWKVGMGTYGRSWSEGYSLLFSPPQGAVGIDFERIVLQTAALAIVSWGALLTLANARNTDKRTAPVANENAGRATGYPSKVKAGLSRIIVWLRGFHYGWVCFLMVLVCAELIVIKHISPREVRFDWTGATFLALFMAFITALYNIRRGPGQNLRRQLILVVLVALFGFVFSLAKDQWHRYEMSQPRPLSIEDTQPH